MPEVSTAMLIADLERRLSAAEQERDAYKRAKAENDERFQLAAQAAEAERDELRAMIAKVPLEQQARIRAAVKEEA